jgi:hypothetical protein
MAESLVNWGIRHVFGMVGHSNLGLADALRRQQDAGGVPAHGNVPDQWDAGCHRERANPEHRA